MEVSQNNNSKQGSVDEYNGNNAWYYNSDNGCLNNNNKYNDLTVRPLLDLEHEELDRLESCPMGDAPTAWPYPGEPGYGSLASMERYLIPLHEYYYLHRQCRKRKNGKPSVIVFELNRAKLIVWLCKSVGEMEYIPRPSICFIITYPRIREVMADDYTGRIVQRFFAREVGWFLEQYHYDEDCYACRVGKGALRAVQKYQDIVYELSNGYTEDVWVGKLDIENCFMSVDTQRAVDLLTAFIQEHMKESKYYWLLLYLTRILYQSLPQEHCYYKSPAYMWLGLPKEKSMRGKRGTALPIGNESSQMMITFKMTILIGYMKSLGLHVVNYCDDFPFATRDKEKLLRDDVWRIEKFSMEALGLRIHPRKRYLQHYSKGVEMLGYKVRFNRILLSDRIMHNIYWSIECAAKNGAADFRYILKTKEHFMASMNSYLGMLKHTNSYRIRQDIFARLKASAWERVLVLDDPNLLKVGLKPHFKQEYYFRMRNQRRRRRELAAVRTLLGAAETNPQN